MLSFRTSNAKHSFPFVRLLPAVSKGKMPPCGDSTIWRRRLKDALQKWRGGQRKFSGNAYAPLLQGEFVFYAQCLLFWHVKGRFFFGWRRGGVRLFFLLLVLLLELGFEVAGGFAVELGFRFVLTDRLGQVVLFDFESGIEQQVLPGRGQQKKGEQYGDEWTHLLLDWHKGRMPGGFKK